MAANVTLTDYPPVIRMKFFQASGSVPGRCIVDAMVAGPQEIATLPRITTLNVQARNFNGWWPDLRLVKAPRVRNGYMRLVFDDSRWRLRDNTISQNYNDRDSLGNVMSGQEKTVTDLAELIGGAAGLTVVSGTVPLLNPGARWAGTTCDAALSQLLDQTGCRFVYNPITQSYTIAHGGTGEKPDFPDRIFRPGPDSTVKKIKFSTAPILYEDTIDVEAVQISTTTGEPELLPTPINLPASPTEDYGQTRLRLWEPTGVTHPEALSMDDVLLLDHRAKAHLFDPDSPMHERARIVRDGFERYPHHQPLLNPAGDVTRMIELTGGGRAFLTEHPVMMTDSTGNLLGQAKLVTSYYVNDTATGKLKRESKTVDINENASDTIEKMIPWIKPVDSTLPDMVNPVWDQLLTSVSTAISEPYKEKAQSVKLTAPIDLNGSGHVGGVYYEFDARQMNRARIYFQVAFNFTPGNQGAIG